jgi:hypothetical protein
VLGKALDVARSRQERSVASRRSEVPCVASVRGSMERMGPIRARVKNGRLILDEPTELPEGTVLDLVVDDEGDDLDENERRALRAAIERSVQELDAGKGRPAEDVLRDLRKRRRP